MVIALGMTVSANPIDVDLSGPTSGPAFAYVYTLVVIVCITVEVSLLRIISQMFHDGDDDRSMMVALIFLNILTLIGVFFPSTG